VQVKLHIPGCTSGSPGRRGCLDKSNCTVHFGCIFLCKFSQEKVANEGYSKSQTARANNLCSLTLGSRRCPSLQEVLCIKDVQVLFGQKKRIHNWILLSARCSLGCNFSLLGFGLFLELCRFLAFVEVELHLFISLVCFG
jgi:hypothetical protein